MDYEHTTGESRNTGTTIDTNDDKPNAEHDEFAFDEDALACLDIPTESTNASDYGVSTRSKHAKSTKKQSKAPKSFTKSDAKATSNKKIRGLGYGAERLNGCDLFDLVSAQVSDTYTDHNGNSASVKKVERLNIYIRPRLHVQDKRHAPTLIKSFIRVLRQIDPTLVLLPLDEKDTSLNHILQNENSLPDNEDAMSRWIAKIKYNVHKKLCFSARISITMPTQEFKSHAFPWCKEHQHWITFDEIKAEETFTAGWLCGVHHKNVDIDGLKNWICSHEGGNELRDLLKLYPRKIWQSVPNSTERRMTDVLAIDGCAKNSGKILKYIYSIKWKGIYDSITFIPMKINDVFTALDMLRAIDAQNAYRNNEF